MGSDRRVHFSSPVEDYQFRGNELDRMNVLDFYWDTYERRLESTPSSSDGGTRETTSIHVRYQPNHNKAATHIRVVRHIQHNALPDFSGQFLPRNDEADLANLYYASVLMLLKPWRTISELKQYEESWSDAYQFFLASASSRQRQIIGNLQHMYRCEDAANKERTKIRDVDDAIEAANNHHVADDADDEDEDAEESAGAVDGQNQLNVPVASVESAKRARGSRRSEQYAEEAVADRPR